jgi:hypothetical protein
MLLVHQRNRRCCWCKRLQALRRTPTLFAAVIVRDRVPKCNAVARHSRVADLGPRVRLLQVQGVKLQASWCAPPLRRHFRVPPRSMYHARPPRAAGGAAGNGGDAVGWCCVSWSVFSSG